MKFLKTAEIRTQFLDYFRRQGHTIVPSSPLVPEHDPTLLFTNAGMVQFKDVFLGRETRTYTRAASCQKCLRAGGKHNDLENVGYTARHHTFFEMLGNFSFGDYFKREAIGYAWEFLTKGLEIPPEKLWVTVYEEDDEAASIWLDEIRVDPKRFSRIGAPDNFWSMGDVGPCGPCTEIFYDHGPEVPGGPPGTPEADGDRYVEIWNLVFMQYDRSADGTLRPLPKPSVDTGMGLERIAAVLQGVHSNYDIDIFQHLIRAAAKVVGTDDLASSSLRVIADHIRASAFLVAEGILPANEGRGYVLRRIIRRAVRHGYRLGCRDLFFYKLVAPLGEVMGDAYPEIVAKRDQIERLLRREEERFAETLEQGMKILEDSLRKIQGKRLPGELIFRLYDTYGFPVDLTRDFALEHGIELDLEGFEREMEKQRQRARAASGFDAGHHKVIPIHAQTRFVGYDALRCDARVLALLKDDAEAERLEAGDKGVVILDRTPFYAEGGGQVGDKGLIRAGEGTLFRVEDTKKQGDTWLHFGHVVQGTLSRGAAVVAEVDEEARNATALNHTATHLLHAALRRLLGEHVQQKGSLVEPERLRFDFSHFEPLSRAQLEEIERLVNQQIRRNLEVSAEVMAYDAALAAGAIALFGEKYGDRVRVLKVGDFSVELCGGTHVTRSGDIGFFKITGESGVAAGVRRIEAVTGEYAVRWAQQADRTLQALGELFRSPVDKLVDKARQSLEHSRRLEKELERLQAKLAAQAGGDLASRAVEVDGVKVLAAKVEGGDPKALRNTLDQLKNKLGSVVVVLATEKDGKVTLVAGVSNDLTDRLKAGELVNFVAHQVGGKGGGRPDFAQAGGTAPEKLDQALASVVDWVKERF
ncbi:alanyl-tRNA synthetase [Methylomarinovum caldicuralii]|uniref:Alanine--tRNA ligase n=1 Tax=Methylomarinovum caldicuralii TaxID=438856 RepID=A0AAU9BXD6_9GAMM|nr:alanine--tRNA ligase [Methylomarinovum caldicuralii]BCX80905.1 alanyl-tRNA synthetase [Methylomarinovum caldicuralii]